MAARTPIQTRCHALEAHSHTSVPALVDQVDQVAWLSNLRQALMAGTVILLTEAVVPPTMVARKRVQRARCMLMGLTVLPQALTAAR